MGGFYGSMIRDGKINKETGKAWVFDDVPEHWKPKVRDWQATQPAGAGVSN